MKCNGGGLASWLFETANFDPATLTTIGLAMTAVSGAVGAIGSFQAADQAKVDAAFNAKMLDQKSNEERAAGQRQMFEANRQGQYQQSRLRALSGAATGDTTDTGVLKLGGDIEQRSQYQALTDLYAGENRGRGYENEASAAIARGDALAKSDQMRGFGNILDAGSSMFMKYNKPRGFGGGFGGTSDYRS